MKRTESHHVNFDPLWVCLLGIAILAVGIVGIVPCLAQWKPYFESASWDRVDAVIKSVSFSKPHGGRGGATCQVQCTYSYAYKGKTYTRHRIGLESEYASGALRTLRHEILQEHLAKNEPVRAWVNPAHPVESLLFRELTDDLSWPPLKCSILSVIGAIVFFVGLRKITAMKRLERRILQYPDQPWRVDGSWDSFTIRAHKAGTMIACWIIGILLALFISPAFIGILNLPFHVWLVLLMPALFALFALWLIGKAVYLTLQYLKYGNPVLELPQLPIVPGTQFHAVLLVKSHLVTENGVQLTFKCVKTTVTGSGKNASTDTKDLHSETRMVAMDMARTTDEGSAIPVAFDVPTGLPDRETEGNPSFEWNLEVKAHTPGIDFSAEFDLPVYAVKDQSLIEKRPAGMTKSGY